MPERFPVRPTSDRVVIRQAEAESVSPGGIVIPEQGKRTPLRGEVLAVGPEVDELQPGDTVFFPRHVGQTVRIDFEDLLMIREEDVSAKVVD